MASESILADYRHLAQHPEIFRLVAAASGDPLRDQRVLRDRYPDGVVRLALTLAALRMRAAAKFSRAAEMWFDRQRLEQATPEAVSQHKAQRFARFPGSKVWDFCCGLGGDAIGLSAGGCEVTAVDRDPVACLLTELNATVLETAVRTLCCPVESITDRGGRVHIDPDRRSEGRARSLRVEDYVPTPDQLRMYMREFQGGAVKVGPASNFGGKFEGIETELVSLHGECKEATLWFGDLAESELWRATVLPAGETISGDPLQAEPQMSQPGEWIYDPDPGVVRAGLVDHLCERDSLGRLDSAEEYLTSADRVATPFATAFRIIADLPNNDRQIRQFVRQGDFGVFEVKSRRIPIDAARWQKTLRGTGDRPAVMIFARVAGKARAIVAERV